MLLRIILSMEKSEKGGRYLNSWAIFVRCLWHSNYFEKFIKNIVVHTEMREASKVVENSFEKVDGDEIYSIWNILCSPVKELDLLHTIFFVEKLPQ